MRKHLQQHHGNQRFAFLPQWLLLLWAGTLLRRRSKGRRFCSTSSDPIMSGLPLLHLWSRSTHQRMMGKFKVLEWSVRALFFANVPIYSFSSPVTFHRCPSRGVRSAPRLWLQVLQAWPGGGHHENPVRWEEVIRSSRHYCISLFPFLPRYSGVSCWKTPPQVCIFYVSLCE